MSLLGKIFAALVSSSFVFALLGGRMNELSAAILSGAEEAVRLSLSLLGMIGFWGGIVSVLNGAGVTALFAKLIRPLLRWVYPDAYRRQRGVDEIAANFAANLLGMGNAALPLGLAAMKKLSDCPDGMNREEASADMVTFAVLNTAPLQLLPTTLITLREAAGSVRPYEIIPPMLVCSVATMLFGVVLCRTAAFLRKIRRRRPYRRVSAAAQKERA